MRYLFFMSIALLLACGGTEESQIAAEPPEDTEVIEPATLSCIELSISCESCSNVTDQLLCNLQVTANDEDACEAANDYFYETCVIDPCAELAELCAVCPEGSYVPTLCQTVLGVGDPDLCTTEYEYFADCLDS
ncbi:MAG: hypothetical protein UY48_C0005G0060 [Candidatus Gottesmanbacteria bacterium GW2011_GWB1_49_7]|uniref:Uncharacterized protein n=1 Tax=Candidatus Gottesmanbacteria bacterium GW2011_GWB1_49_7 TaxID=1618448 RepID=A0A0G1Z2X7_9BACT|nr:MAG: hypothetical protein UY48_C0005G0060 [Candidatus Gottesmanbacteria bacterium GW2011_GWB1_49_7]